MGLNKKSVDDINANGKRVLVRCDFNVPLKNGEITDETRIVAALPTIQKLIKDGGKVILCSHLGKVKNGPNEGESLAPVAKRLSEKLGKEVGESREQIRRFIRLTELVPEILQMVDDRQIAFRPAVEISYLTEEQQYTLLEAMEYNDATPSLAQAIKMKKFMQEGKLTNEVIQSIMQEEKPNQKEKPAFKDERITNLIPKSIPRGQETDFVVKALEFYNRHLQRSKDRER